MLRYGSMAHARMARRQVGLQREGAIVELAGTMDAVQAWLLAQLAQAEAAVLSGQFAVQVAAIAVALGLAAVLAPRLRALLARTWRDRQFDAQLGIGRLHDSLTSVSLPLIWVALQWLSVLLLLSLDQPVDLLRITVSLLTAWVGIRLLSGMVLSPAWTRAIAGIVWLLAAMAILGVLDDIAATLDGLALNLGTTRISALGVVKALLTLLLLIWLATLLTRLFEHRIASRLSVGPSTQLLLGKLLRFMLFVLAGLLAISATGIDLTALALFGGAIGIGVGLGLQPIVGNLVAGLLMLLDRSIKPGDIVTVGDTLGWVESLNARYTSVRTRDGVEHLIPNETLVTTRVENWSHTDRMIRLRAPVGISYRSDVRRAIALCIEAAAATDRVLAEPGPRCLLRGFGDSSVDLEVRFWIEDPENGRANVTSQVLLGIWDRFHDHGIEIPYPQRDLHLRSAEVLPVRMSHDSGSEPD